VAEVAQSTEIDCAGKETREVNRLIKEAEGEVLVRNPDARHCLGVAILEPLRVVFDGPVGWYCATMGDGADFEVRGNAGWGVGQNMMSGSLHVRGHAGSSAGATMRGGTIRIDGDAGARTGIALKGGTLVVGGSVGYMSGFMMQTGTFVVCGDAADGIGDSIYEGAIFVGGTIASAGSDAVEAEVSDEDRALLASLGVEPARSWTKLVAGRRLWNFSKKEFEVWKAAL
jgi:methylamine---glutamate N-methyltransferase subunit B